MEITPCLQNLVGISDTTCECFTDSKPDDYEPGSSGLNLDALINLKMIGAAVDCSEDENIWTLGAQAIKEGTTNVVGNLLDFWAKKHSIREPWDDFLTKKSDKGSFMPPGSWAGIKITPHWAVKYGEIEILDLGMLFTDTGTVPFYIYDALGLVASYTGGNALNTTGGVYQSNPLDPTIKLPFRTQGVPRQAYYLLYQVGANLPLRNEMICRNCNPSLALHMDQWATVHGVSGSVLASREDWSGNSDGYGLVPKVKIRCYAEKSLCDGGMEMGQDPNAITIAEAIQYKAAARLCGMLKRHPNINRYTLLDGDELAQLEGKYNAVAKARVESLSGTDLPLRGGCYNCIPGMQHQTANF